MVDFFSTVGGQGFVARVEMGLRDLTNESKSQSEALQRIATALESIADSLQASKPF
jgi:hypothetical protein